MKKAISRIGTGVLAGALFLGMTSAAFAGTSGRYAGNDRYATAIKIAEAFGTAPTVYLTRGDNQADAVTGGKLRGGPMLLINGNATVQTAVKNTIAKLGASKVVVLGGPGAVPDSWVNAVAAGKNVSRLAGADRYATAVEISKDMVAGGPIEKVYLANGLSLVDALAGGAVSDDFPILLTSGPNSIPPATAAELRRLQPKQIVVLGGEGAVSAGALASAKNSVEGKADMSQKEYAETITNANNWCMMLHGWATVTDDFGNDIDMVLQAHAIKFPKPGAAYEKIYTDMIQTGLPRICWLFVNSDNTEPIWATMKDRTTGNYLLTEEEPQVEPEIDGKVATLFVGANYLARPLEKPTSIPDLSWITPSTTRFEDGPGFQALNSYLSKTYGYYYAHPNTKQRPTRFGEMLRALGLSWPNDTDALGISPSQYIKNDITNVINSIDWDQLNEYNNGQAAKAKQLTDHLNQAMDKLTKMSVSAGGSVSDTRLSGNTRYQTALQIANYAYPNGAGAKTIYLANGTASADATVGGMTDNNFDLTGPILLVQKDSLPPEVQQYLQAVKNAGNSPNLQVLGGNGVVSDAVLNQAKAALGAS